MQSVSSRIWTPVAVSISYDDNHYTTGTSMEIFSINENVPYFRQRCLSLLKKISFGTLPSQPIFQNDLIVRLPSLLWSPVGWGCRVQQLHLCRGVRHPTNECPGYGTKQSDSEVPVMLELWGMRSRLPGSLWPRVVEPDKN